MDELTKVCTGCGVKKSLSEYRAQKDRSGKLCARCKTCERGRANKRWAELPADVKAKRYARLKELRRAWREAHPKPVKERKKDCADYYRKWREGRREIIRNQERVRGRRARAQNPEKFNRKQREYRVTHREHLCAYDRARHPKRRAKWLALSPDDRRAILRRRYLSQDLDARRQSSQKRRARIANAPAIEHINRKAIIARDKSICYLCGRILAPNEITLDHIIPLSRGGPHTTANLKVACGPCNSGKHAKLLEELHLQQSFL